MKSINLLLGAGESQEGKTIPKNPPFPSRNFFFVHTFSDGCLLLPGNMTRAKREWVCVPWKF